MRSNRDIIFAKEFSSSAKHLRTVSKGSNETYTEWDSGIVSFKICDIMSLNHKEMM